MTLKFGGKRLMAQYFPLSKLKLAQSMETSACWRGGGGGLLASPVKMNEEEEKLLTMMKELIKLVAARTNRVWREKPGRMME